VEKQIPRLARDDHVSELLVTTMKAVARLRFRQLQHHTAALAGLYGWQLAIPLVDERARIFDAAQVQELRRK
jgi:hypothetical protein